MLASISEERCRSGKPTVLLCMDQSDMSAQYTPVFAADDRKPMSIAHIAGFIQVVEAIFLGFLFLKFFLELKFHSSDIQSCL